MLKFMLERNKDLVSAGVRRADGTLVVAAGDHANTWKPLANDHSTDRADAGADPGRRASAGGSSSSRSSRPACRTSSAWRCRGCTSSLFMFGSCFGAFYMYLGRMLRHLDPSHAVPARVRSALDTLAEGLLVIDKKQNIVLANQAFATLTGAHAGNARRAARCPSSAGSGPTARRCRRRKRPGRRRCARGRCSATACSTSPTTPGQLHTFSVNCSPVDGAGRQGGRRADQPRRRHRARGEEGRAAPRRRTRPRRPTARRATSWPT